MQFFDGLRSGQDRSLQLSRQRCGGYNKVGGNKKSHHGRWWDNKSKRLASNLSCTSIIQKILVASRRRCISKRLALLSRTPVTAVINNSISAISINKRINDNLLIGCIRTINLNTKAPMSRVLLLGKFVNLVRKLRFISICSKLHSTGKCTCIALNCFNIVRTVSLRHGSLSRSQNHRAFRNQGLLAGLVNVTSQRGDEQGGQDGQDDQNDDQLDEGEALFVFQFF